MPYVFYPDDIYINQNIRLVYLTKPYIRYVYLDPPAKNQADIPIGYNSDLHLYGMYATVAFSTHLLPDFRKKTKLSFHKIFCKVAGVVYFINDSKQDVVVDSFETVINSEEEYNYYKSIKVFINPKWRDVDGTHAEQHKPQKYYVKLFATEYNDEPPTLNIFDANSNSLMIQNTIDKMLNPIKYDTNVDFEKWRKFDDDEKIG